MVLRKLDSHMQRMKLDHSLTPYTKINSKWMKDLNVRQEYIEIIENTGNTLIELGHSNFLKDTSMKARETKEKMNYWDFIRIKSFCTAKETVNKTKLKDNLQNGRRYLRMTYQIKGWYPRSVKNVLNSTAKKQTIQS